MLARLEFLAIVDAGPTGLFADLESIGRLQKAAAAILRAKGGDIVETDRRFAAWYLRNWLFDRVKAAPQPEAMAPQLAVDLVKCLAEDEATDAVAVDLPADYAAPEKVYDARRAIKNALGRTRRIDEPYCEVVIASALRALGYPRAKAKSLYRSSARSEM